MKFRHNRVFWISVMLHFTVLLLLFFSTIVEAFRKKEPEHIFVMVEESGEIAETLANQSAVEPAEDLFEPITAVPEMPIIPDVKIPEPVVPRIDPPKPSPERPQEPSQLMSAEDFFKKFGEKKPRVQKPSSRVTATVPTIDLSKVQSELNALKRSPESPVSSHQNASQLRNELLRYSAALRARLDRAWVKPAGLFGQSLLAEVIFDVSASGVISNIRFNPASGSNAFDQSILTAFKQVASAGPTPDGRPQSFTIEFRMSD